MLCFLYRQAWATCGLTPHARGACGSTGPSTTGMGMAALMAAAKPAPRQAKPLCIRCCNPCSKFLSFRAGRRAGAGPLVRFILTTNKWLFDTTVLTLQNLNRLCFAAYHARSIDELSGRTTGLLGYIRPDLAHAIGGTAELALRYSN